MCHAFMAKFQGKKSEWRKVWRSTLFDSPRLAWKIHSFACCKHAEWEIDNVIRCFVWFLRECTCLLPSSDTDFSLLLTRPNSQFMKFTRGFARSTTITFLSIIRVLDSVMEETYIYSFTIRDIHSSQARWMWITNSSAYSIAWRQDRLARNREPSCTILLFNTFFLIQCRIWCFCDKYTLRYRRFIVCLFNRLIIFCVHDQPSVCCLRAPHPAVTSSFRCCCLPKYRHRTYLFKFRMSHSFLNGKYAVAIVPNRRRTSVTHAFVLL